MSGAIGDYQVRYCDADGRERRVLVREVTEVVARREVEEVLGGEVLAVALYDAAAEVRRLLETGAEARERGLIAARILQVSHEVRVMAAGTEPKIVQMKAREYLQQLGGPREFRAWDGPLEEGWAVVERLAVLHAALLADGHGTPDIKPVAFGRNDEEAD